MKTLSFSAILLIGSVALAHAAGAPVASYKSAKGDILVESSNKMSLYTFKKDKKGKSNCNGDCAVKWPPLFAGNNAKATGDYTIITRADGSKQWGKDGKALYFWFKDKKPGDIKGHGVKGVWDLARP